MDERQAVEILLVEDDPHDVELTLRALRKANLANQIHVVHDGEAALAWIFGDGQSPESRALAQPKLILLDLKLPKVDGLEVLQALKGDPRTSHLPVVVLTSSNEQSDILTSYELGVNSYIVKPVKIEAFFQAVTQLGLYWMVLNQAPATDRAPAEPER